MKVRLSLDNLVDVFFKISNTPNRKEYPRLKQEIVEEMVSHGGLPVWERDANGSRIKVLRLIQFNDVVEL